MKYIYRIIRVVSLKISNSRKIPTMKFITSSFVFLVILVVINGNTVGVQGNVEIEKSEIFALFEMQPNFFLIVIDLRM